MTPQQLEATIQRFRSLAMKYPKYAPMYEKVVADLEKARK